MFVQEAAKGDRKANDVSPGWAVYRECRVLFSASPSSFFSRPRRLLDHALLGCGNNLFQEGNTQHTFSNLTVLEGAEYNRFSDTLS